MTELNTNTIYIKELNLDMIKPTSAGFKDPKHYGSKIAVIGKAGCFCPGTLVLMYDKSSKKVEDVQIGEQVMGPDDTPRLVQELFHDNDLMYLIKPYDNYGEYTVNQLHCLVLVYRGENETDFSKGQIIEISVREFLEFSEDSRKDWKTFRNFDSPSKYADEVGFDIIPKGKGDYYGFSLNLDKRFLLFSRAVVRNTGKSTLLGSILYAKKHIFPVGMAMCGTEDSNHFYSSIMPSSFVFNNYDEAQVEKFIKRQKLALEHVENPWAVLILDDCTDEPAIFRKPLQQGMYKRGRHWKMLYILSLQYALDIRPSIRTNIDGTFILREPSLAVRKKLYENYAGIIPDFKLFCEIMDQITNDYTALYIHNVSGATNNWKDYVFWYKATPAPKNFKLGCDTFWDHHYQRYNEEYVDPIMA